MSRTSFARGVFASARERKMSPVEICGRPIRSCSKRACVPLPAPGAPINTMIAAMATSDELQVTGRNNLSPVTRHLSLISRSAPAQPSSAAKKAFVVTHYKLRFNLCNGVHGHADENQKTGTAEIKLVAHAIRDPPEPGRCR